MLQWPVYRLLLKWPKPSPPSPSIFIRCKHSWNRRRFKLKRGSETMMLCHMCFADRNNYHFRANAMRRSSCHSETELKKASSYVIIKDLESSLNVFSMHLILHVLSSFPFIVMHSFFDAYAVFRPQPTHVFHPVSQKCWKTFDCYAGRFEKTSSAITDSQKHKTFSRIRMQVIQCLQLFSKKCWMFTTGSCRIDFSKNAHGIVSSRIFLRAWLNWNAWSFRIRLCWSSIPFFWSYNGYYVRQYRTPTDHQTFNKVYGTYELASMKKACTGMV